MSDGRLGVGRLVCGVAAAACRLNRPEGRGGGFLFVNDTEVTNE